MTILHRMFKPGQNLARKVSPADLVILLVVACLAMVGVRVASNNVQTFSGPSISLDPKYLPWYALLSLGRMTAAYVLSMGFSLLFGYYTATNKRARWYMLPILDVLQSVPILSFLPIILLAMTAVFPQGIAIELSSVILIVTSQAWNIAYSWYQSLATIPKELRDATKMFGLNPWFRFKTLMLPFGAIGLIWNSVVSWSNGWFFLMAAEAFRVGKKDFRLPGIGAYLWVAADQGDSGAIISAVIVLIVMIVALDQLVWRPLVAWADRFRLDMVGSDTPPTSWFLDAINESQIVGFMQKRVFRPTGEWLDRLMSVAFRQTERQARPSLAKNLIRWVSLVLLYVLIVHSLWSGGQMLLTLNYGQWLTIFLGVFATLMRVMAALVLSLAWTIPVGVAIGLNPKVSRWAQPVAQIIAAVPATALFPAFILWFLKLTHTLEVPAILLMMSGIHWYLLFNVIAGASAIPKDLRYTASLLRMRGKGWWRDFVLPSLFPYLVTGAITAFAGAWNACIVAEYVTFQDKAYEVFGVGAIISKATNQGDYPMLLGSTLCLIFAVVAMNRLVWRHFYQLSEDRYRME